MATAVSTYAFINAKLRARISKLLDESFFLGIARSRSLVEAVATLNDTPYAGAVEVYNRTGDIKLCELELVRTEYQALGALERYTPKAIMPFTRAVLKQYEVATLKHALRLWFERVVRGRPVDDKVAYLERGEQVSNLPVDEVINAGDAEGVIAALEGTPYSQVIQQPMETLGEKQSLFEAEVALDRWYFSHLVASANELSSTDSAVALRLIGIQIDIQNVNWLVRMKHFHKLDASRLAASVMPGGTLITTAELAKAYQTDRPLEPLVAALGPRYSGLVRQTSPEEEHNQLRRLALLEDLLRSVLYQEIRRTLGGYPFTIGTILAYFLLTQSEVRTLISVLNAKAYDLSADRIEGLI